MQVAGGRDANQKLMGANALTAEKSGNNGMGYVERHFEVTLGICSRNQENLT